MMAGASKAGDSSQAPAEESIPAGDKAGLRGTKDPSTLSSSGSSDKVKDSEGGNHIFSLRNEGHQPPCRVTFQLPSSGRWEVTTMGGALWDGKTAYGLVVEQRSSQGPEDIPTPAEIKPLRQRAPALTRAPLRPNIKFVKPTTPKDLPIREKSMGYIVLNDSEHVFGRWSLVALKTRGPIENAVSIPGGFGESFVVTATEKPISNGLVWIVTRSGEIVHGENQSFRDDDVTTNYQWAVHTFSDLSEHYITYDDGQKLNFDRCRRLWLVGY